uniref:EF-hand domain-containing protein n=1 Tax=Plectus sambesii TaxID=2011161 RepID=A0A914V9V6_9BILA
MANIAFLLAAFLVGGALATSKVLVDRPRGVPLSRKALYDSSKEFKCFDGLLTIPFDQVNDDYCDCKDGSDEPGTSACPNGRFTCVNLGHRPIEIPSGRVNDQLCDCCDGSDEYSGLVQCPNICDELGKQAREESERRAAVTKEGFAKRQEMAKEGQKLRQEMQTKLEGLKKDRDALQPQRDQLDTKKQEAERLEKEAKDKHREAHEAVKEEKRRLQATEAFKALDVNGDSKITLEEIK